MTEHDPNITLRLTRPGSAWKYRLMIKEELADALKNRGVDRFVIGKTTPTEESATYGIGDKGALTADYYGLDSNPTLMLYPSRRARHLRLRLYVASGLHLLTAARLPWCWWFRLGPRNLSSRRQSKNHRTEVLIEDALFSGNRLKATSSNWKSLGSLQWEVWRQLSHPSSLGSFITERVNNLVLLTPGWIDVAKFDAAFRQGVRFDEPGSSFISHFVNRPPGRAMVAVCSSSLRYCQTCIEAGYHSTLFQLRCVQSCPLHGLPLRDQCLSCRLKVPYKLPRGRNPAYGCGCGHAFSILKRCSPEASLDPERVGRSMRELALSLASRKLVMLQLASHLGLSGPVTGI